MFNRLFGYLVIQAHSWMEIQCKTDCVIATLISQNLGVFQKLKPVAFFLGVYVASLCFVASLHRLNSALLGRCQKFKPIACCSAICHDLG